MKYNNNTSIIPFRIGQGYDVHRLKEGLPCKIGGVLFDSPKGPVGHSDADVLLHALCDALLGALALGDIGTHFSDQDPAHRNRDSREFVRSCLELVKAKGYVVGNVDSIVVCEIPRIKPRREEMVSLISELLQVSADQVSVKATTEEGMGFTGSKEGIAAWATVLLVREEA